MKWTYLSIDLLTLFFPLVLSFDSKLKFHKQFGSFFKANLIVAGIFILWDMLFTHLGVWGFNSRYLTGLSIFNLPIEEVLFFVCVPFACIFSYACIDYYFNVKWSSKIENIFIVLCSLSLLVVGIYAIPRLYTATTFISLGIILLVFKYVMKVTWLPKLFTTYAILIFPFFVVNGLLTGTGLDEPIVWYNNAENLGIRILTVPIEDLFYGFEMVLLHVFIMEKSKSVH
jgi:lycopene cyclase domain-containing protein